MHKAFREALANCFANADFYLPRGLVILKDSEKIVLQNPGSIRTGKEQMLLGGVSDPRNKGIMKMLNLLKIGERAGSGVPGIFSVWRESGLATPTIEETFGPDRVIVTLPLTKIPATNQRQTSDKPATKTSGKALKSKTIILSLLKKKGETTTNEIAKAVGLAPSWVRELLNEMVKEGSVISIGERKARRYKLLK